MRDCPNAEVRDQLPDLVHGRLEAGARARVEAHLATCPDCTAEVALLRTAAAALRGRPAVDVAAIVRALPRPAAPMRGRAAAEGVRPLAPHGTARGGARGLPQRWRIAAGIGALVVGGLTYGVAQRLGGPDTGPPGERVAAPPDSLPRVAGTPAPVNSPPRPLEPPGRRPSADRRPPGELAQAELALGAAVGDLSDAELRLLLAELQALDGVPSAEPDVESVPLPVGPPGEG